jgi:hypothetical protein
MVSLLPQNGFSLLTCKRREGRAGEWSKVSSCWKFLAALEFEKSTIGLGSEFGGLFAGRTRTGLSEGKAVRIEELLQVEDVLSGVPQRVVGAKCERNMRLRLCLRCLNGWGRFLGGRRIKVHNMSIGVDDLWARWFVTGHSRGGGR